MKPPSESDFCLSCGQQALWYLNQLEPASTAYHLGLGLRLTGRLDESALSLAWADMCAAHPQLRARFVLRDGQPAVAIDPLPAPLRIEAASALNLQQAWNETACRPFALGSEAPARGCLIRDTDGSAQLLLCLHHIAGDLWSTALLLREFSLAYQARVSGQTPALPREQMEHTAFAAAERRWLNGVEGEAAWNFWREYLDGVETEPLFTSTAGPGQGGETGVVLGPEEASLVQCAAHERETTPYTVLLACYARMLGEETGRSRLVIGTPATLRSGAALRRTVGYLVNSVPVLCPVNGDEDPMAAIVSNLRRALEHRRFPFSVLVERLRMPRASGVTPLFQSMFAYQSLSRADRDLLPLTLNPAGGCWKFGNELTAEPVAMPLLDVQFPLSLTLGRDGDGFSGRLQYDGRGVTAEDAARLARQFPALIAEYLGAGKGRALVALPAFSGRLEELFDEAARRTPDAVAVSERGLNLTYEQANARAEMFAAHLNAALLDDTRPVSVQMPSCSEAAILILAILKSGRAFVPIDPGEPEARRNAALRQTGAGALLLPSGGEPGVLPDGVAALTPERLQSFPRATGRVASPSSTAYLVFTSGSSGEPKAVEVEHAAVINHARAAVRLFQLSPRDRVLQFHTLAFDASFEEIFPTWAAGARIVFEPRARELSAAAFLETLASSGTTVLNLPTSYWHLLTGEIGQLSLRPPANLRLLVVGGEQASWKAFLAWRQIAPCCRWINTYGPTETTITALAYEPPEGISAGGILPIGRPIDGVIALVLDASGEPLTVGEGELLIGGNGLAIGYHGDPAMTAVKFVTRIVAGRVQRLYRTGDRVRLRRDGNFEYLGRLDRQLKIRGYRIDPEEIERVLLAHPGIADATVTARELKGELNLSAWIARVNGSPTEPEMRAWLADRFPPHMVPSRLNFVARLPRKPSGKVDAAALPHGTLPRVSRGKHGPRELATLFSELLGHKIGPRDNFFLSGGHSLLTIKLLGRVEARYGVRLSVADVLAAPSPLRLWKRLHATSHPETEAVREVIPVETPVSFQQRRALLAHELGCPALANIVALFRIVGRLDPAGLAQAAEAVSRRNGLLRCGYVRTNSGFAIREATEFPGVERRVLRHRDFERALTALAAREGARPFRLDGRRPWIRLLLASNRSGRKSHLLAITHHAVADGWAFELLLDDLRVEYERVLRRRMEAPRSARDYRSYALAQVDWLRGPDAIEQAAFWKKRLAGAEEPRLAFRRAAPDSSWRRERREVILPARVSRDLRRAAAGFGTTPFALMMACFKALIHRHSGQRDIVLGTVVSNRSAKADQNLFGPLQNPVLIRDRVTPEMSMRTLVRRVSRSLREAADHGALPFEQVLRDALSERPVSSDGGIQFLRHDHTSRRLQLGSASLQPVELPAEESPFELSIAVSAAVSRVRIVFEYRPTIYPASGIEQLARQYETLLLSFAADPRLAVGELNLTPTREQRAFDRRMAKVHRPPAELLHEGFETQVRRNPKALALVAPGRRLTYGELDAMAEFTRRALTDGGLKPGGRVAVMLPKGWEQLVACLAVLKAGGVYVPVDPDLPARRLNAIFGPGGFHSAIVAVAASCEGVPWVNRVRSVVTIHSPAPGESNSRERSPRRAKPDSAAYIIFTSGSTGVPKGVTISHQAAMTTIREINRRFDLCSRDRVFAVSSLGFDLSVFDIFGTLRAGGTVVMPASRDPQDWLRQVRSEKVTVWNSVPCLFELLLDEAAARGLRLETLRLILLSGDFVSLALAGRARRTLPRCRIVSLGGATEAAIWSIAHEVAAVDPAWRSVPYGRALAGQEMFVLDTALNHCPAGVAGELFIAGAGLAEGYWRNERETRRRFLVHPERRVRLYRTGDQGRYLENSEIEILGRLDAQIKWNGVRLEPGEIEAALGSAPPVRQAVVEVRDDGAGRKRLVAFVVAEPGTGAPALFAHLKKILPAALLPSVCVFLDRLPLTSNGKVDRAALRALTVPDAAPGAAAPANPTAEWIAALWSELLGGAAVDVDEDFFALGGHSLLAIQMLQRVRSHFAVNLPLASVLEHPTVRGLTAAVTAAAATSTPTLPRRATAELERDSEPVIARPLRFSRSKPDAVLLTGATGQLGSALLRELLRGTSDRIYCLVRAGSLREAEGRLSKVLPEREIPAAWRSRVVAVPADLSRERFGLEAAAFTALAGDIRAAYHCAAEVNFIAPYEKLAACNVNGTRELIRLATSAGAVLHHVSSVAVFPYGGARRRFENEEIAGVTKLLGGYAQSKWTAERMVWKAIARGLRAVIYRPAQIVGRTSNGAAHDLFHQVLRACDILEAVPDIETKIDMVTAEYAAAAIGCLSARESSIGRAFHLVHPQPMALRDFVELFSPAPPLIPAEVWLERLAREAGSADDPGLHLVSLLAEGLEPSELVPPDFDCSNTLAGLQGTGISCPPFDRQIVERELRGIVRSAVLVSQEEFAE
jgi:amino acid adenylation domain-containing protein/thioester reductase-like protein